MNAIRQPIARTGVLIFFGMLFLPMVMTLFGLTENRINWETRKKASIPEVPIRNPGSWVNYLKTVKSQLSPYFEDHFPLRETLLDLFQLIKERGLNVNPFPERVVEGKNGWLFLGDYYSEVLKESKGLSCFTDQQVSQITSSVLRVKNTLDSMGIVFCIAVAPNKLTVCGEYLNIVASGKPTKFEQLDQSLKMKGFHLIDLKYGFSQYPSKSLFYSQDSHWNGFGAFLAYQNLVKGIREAGFRDFPLKTRDKMVLIAGSRQVRDLNPFLRRESREFAIWMHPRKPSGAKELPAVLTPPESFPGLPQQYEKRFSFPGKPLKILIFHDSFFGGIYIFLNDDARESVFIFSRFDMNLVKKEKPDLVVYETVERNLDLLQLLKKE